MPKRKQISVPSPDIASPAWEVWSDYVVFDGEIVARGVPTHKHYLAARETYQSLLHHFIEIKSEAQARDYVQHLGFPVKPNFVRGLPGNSLPVDDILECAAFVRLLMHVSDTCRSDVNLIKDHWVKEPTEEAMKNSESCEILFMPQPDDMERTTATAFHSPPGGGDHWWRREDGDSLSVHTRFIYPSSSWLSWKATKQAYIYVAQRYIAEHLDMMLTGVQPTTHWMQKPSGDWALTSGLKVRTPWAAICLALYEYCTGSSGLVKCIRQGCPQYFVPKNRKREFCSGACQRDCHRYPDRREPR